MQRDFPDEDLYGALGIQEHARDADITRAYRKLAMAWHPDRNASLEAADRFRRIRLAYEVLRDPQRRAEYDRSARGHASPQPRPPRPSAAPREQHKASAARAGNLSRRVAITLDEQVHGCRVKLKATRTEYCGSCGGSGLMESGAATCGRCRGSGRVRRPILPFFLFAGEEVACEHCGGSGRVLPKCAACRGSGSGTTRTGYLEFDIPAGVCPETTKRVRGFGRPARSGEVAGDLLIKIAFAPHPLFDLDFPHLRCRLPISVYRILAGGSIDVPTLDATAAVSLPRDAGDGSVLRLAGQGLLADAGGQRGDLFVTLQAVRPANLSEAQRKLIDELEQSFAEQPGQSNDLAEWARRVSGAQRQREKAARRRA